MTNTASAARAQFTNVRELDRWPADLAAKADEIQYVYRCRRSTCKTPLVPVPFGGDAEAAMRAHIRDAHPTRCPYHGTDGSPATSPHCHACANAGHPCRCADCPR